MPKKTANVAHDDAAARVARPASTKLSRRKLAKKKFRRVRNDLRRVAMAQSVSHVNLVPQNTFPRLFRRFSRDADRKLRITRGAAQAGQDLVMDMLNRLLGEVAHGRAAMKIPGRTVLDNQVELGAYVARLPGVRAQRGMPLDTARAALANAQASAFAPKKRVGADGAAGEPSQ